MAADEPDQVVDADDDDLTWHCYKHPAKEAGVKCRRCERPICPDCMISAPVGFQCRECVKGAPAVRTMRSLRPDPHLTMALIAVNVVVFLSRVAAEKIAVDGPDVADGEWWRIVTGGFLHYDILHIGFNMALLWWLGNMLEPSLGRVRFGVLYLGALVAGSLGAIVLEPNALTGGASGAVFGLMAATFLSQRRNGIDPMQTGIGGLLLVNLVLSFRPGVSIGGHVGGLLGGALLISILNATDGDQRQRWLGAGAAALATLAIAGVCLYVAANPL